MAIHIAIITIPSMGAVQTIIIMDITTHTTTVTTMVTAIVITMVIPILIRTIITIILDRDMFFYF